VSPETLSPDIAIRCRDLSKTYRVYSRLILGLTRDVFLPHRPNPHVRRIEAVKNLSLDVRKGEVFGFLGPNGSGKSTLLACIAGISPYDEGSIETNGEVEALLKIGVGFHPHFTGKENIVIGLISMGTPVDEAREAVDAVLEFAELKAFGDLPFYSYSSGMMARLQFSVAVHRTPEILILDEALSAGDGFFNSKATRRVEDICANGTTVLLVTHSVSMVESLCHRAGILREGELIAEGAAQDIGTQYRKQVSDFNTAAYSSYQQPEGADEPSDQGTGEATITDAAVELPDNGRVAAWSRPMSLIVDLDVTEPIVNPRYRVDIYNAHNGALATSFGNFCVDPDTGRPHTVSLGRLEGRVRVRFDIPALPLGGYTYFWSFALIPRARRRPLETESDYYVSRRIMGYFQVESFPEIPQSIGRTVFTETPVVPRISALADEAPTEVTEETIAGNG